LKPKLICTLGATAMEYFTGETKMSENHGKVFRSEKTKIPVLLTYHPASIFHNRPLKEVLQNDLKKIPEVLKSVDVREIA
jgi:uracil-DNA glycosylase family 4